MTNEVVGWIILGACLLLFLPLLFGMIIEHERKGLIKVGGWKGLFEKIKKMKGKK